MDELYANDTSVGLLTAVFNIVWKLHFRLFSNAIKDIHKTLHFLVEQLHKILKITSTDTHTSS